LIFDYKGLKIQFVIDRGYLEGEIIRNETYIPFSKLNPRFRNLEKNLVNVDLIIEYLHENKKEIII